MRSLTFAAIVLAALLCANVVPRPGHPLAASAASTIEVTSTSDAGGAGGAICPHATLCTLRHALELANAEPGESVVTITFDPSVFAPDAPAEIAVGSNPLPTVSRPSVTIDGTAAGVSIVNNSPSLTTVSNGLTATANDFVLLNIHVSGFKGSCVAVSGEHATIGAINLGNILGNCATGLAVSGINTTIRANHIGFTPEGAAGPVASGIVVAAGNVAIGGPAAAPGAANHIGFADVAIYVGSGSPESFSDVQIERNFIGRRPTGEPAPVTFGIILSQPSNDSRLLANNFANATTAISVSANSGATAVVNNRFIGNIFEGIGAMAIDLGQDGIRQVNDAGDADEGPNHLLNHPTITRATQSRISGFACAGCQVQLYVAEHTPGGANDYGFAPLVSGLITADASGLFALDNPVAGPGDWVIAMTTDADGNSSEFGPSARVGAGAVLCGNIQLHAGWNHVGYFGAEPVSLLSSFSPVPSGVVTAIYRVIDGTDDYERWFSSTTVGRTLTSVQPGESYWFYAEGAATLPGGFSLSFPVTVQLKTGWNDFVYLGAADKVADALGSLGASAFELYQYAAETGQWLRFGSLSVPTWAQAFTDMNACGVYQLRISSSATLVPLQP